MMEEDMESVQVLKVWDILEGTLKRLELIRCIKTFYRSYSEETRNRCNEKLWERDLEVPKSWSKLDLSNGIATMILIKEVGSSSS